MTIMLSKPINIVYLVWVLSALAIAYLNYAASKWKRDKFATQLEIILWKMETEPKVSLHYDSLNWWKLVFAGIILSTSLFLMLDRRFGVSTSATVSATLFAGWTAFIYWFWIKEISPKYNNKKPKSNEDSKKKGNSVAASNSDTAGASSWEVKKRDIKSNTDTRLPVTILTGFLGSGKTTLLKKLLGNSMGLKILVIENEIGTEGIDHSLLVQQTDKENIILMNNGCICCTVRKDLIETFHALFTKDDLSKIEWIVIETTGLADPAPMIQSLYMDSLCRQRMRLDSVITLVDGVHFNTKHVTDYLKIKNKSGGGATSKLDASSSGIGAHKSGVPEAIQQVIFADKVIISKLDLLTSKENDREKEINELHKSIKLFNQNADIIHAVRGGVHPSLLLNIKAYETNVKIKEDLLKSQSPRPSFIPQDSNGNILKKKVAFNALNPVNITTSDNSVDVNTISLKSLMPMDLDKFNLWIHQLLQGQGQNIYRLKGFIYMQGHPDLVFVAHGVHMIFDGEVSQNWLKSENSKDNNSITSTLVLIGLNLNESELKSGFLSCQSGAAVAAK